MSTATETQRERAAMAVREFQRLRPTLQGFVRALTGSSTMTLEAGPTSGTTGQVVYLRPPIELAKRDPHDRARCDERDEWSLPACPACARSEAVYTTLFHEISHLVAGSLKVDSRRALREAALRGAQFGTPEYRRFIDERALPQPEFQGVNAYDFLIKIDPMLLGWIRAMDDARIDAASFRARPGVADMRWNQTTAILTRGVEVGGDYLPWSDRNIEEQFPIAALVATQGHPIDTFAPEIAATFALPEFAPLVGVIPSDTVHAAELAVAWLGALNALGLYDLPLPPPPAPEEESDEGDEQKGDADDAAGGQEDGQQPGEGGDGGDQGDGTGAGDDSGAGGGGDGPAEPDDDAGGGDGGGASDPGDAGDGDQSESGGDDAGAGEDAQPAAGSAGVGGADQQEGQVDGEAGAGLGEDLGSGDSAGGGAAAHGDPVADPALGDTGDADAGVQHPLNDSGVAEDADRGDQEDAGSSEVDAARELIERSFSGVDHATPEQVAAAVDAGSGHEQTEEIMHGGEPLPDAVIDGAIRQAEVFDSYSANVTGLTVNKPGEGEGLRTGRKWPHVPIADRVLAPSVMHARRVFSDSKLDKHQRNLRRGKLNQGALARRAPFGDDRVFKRTLRAEGIDFEVVIGLDISGSTRDGCIRLIKQAGEGLANVLHRVGVDFALYGHTTNKPTNWHDFEQVMYPVKRATDPWGAQQREYLAALPPLAGSLDGHNLQFYRKLLDRSRARKKLLVYFTDGEIPEINAREERRIIEEEANLFKKRGYSILGVGIGNDSPKKFGLDTIRIDSGDDIFTVIKEIEKRITTT